MHRLDADGQPLDPRSSTASATLISVVDDGLVADVDADDAFVVVDSFAAPTALWRVGADGLATPGGEPPAHGRRLTGGLSVATRQLPVRRRHRGRPVPDPSRRRHTGRRHAGDPDGYGGFTITLSPAWQPRIARVVRGRRAVRRRRPSRRPRARRGRGTTPARASNKQNVFDDFHAGADHLVARGLTSRERLAILGGSNGGLLVGAALTQRPDLCRAVLCAVPLLDMIRFPQFLIAKLWTSEYGDPDVAEEFAWLHAYSPYHHVVDGTCYPAMLVQTAEGDTRVDPLHARKMVALLQAASSCQDEPPDPAVPGGSRRPRRRQAGVASAPTRSPTP